MWCSVLASSQDSTCSTSTPKITARKTSFKEKEWGGNDLAGLQSSMDEKTHPVTPREPICRQCRVTLWRKGIGYTYCNYVDISSKALEDTFHKCLHSLPSPRPCFFSYVFSFSLCCLFSVSPVHSCIHSFISDWIIDPNSSVPFNRIIHPSFLPCNLAVFFHSHFFGSVSSSAKGTGWIR